jgi:hypothetical protein
MRGTTEGEHPQAKHDERSVPASGAKNRRSIALATTRIDIVDRSVEQAHVWINDVAGEFGAIGGSPPEA